MLLECLQSSVYRASHQRVIPTAPRKTRDKEECLIFGKTSHPLGLDLRYSRSQFFSVACNRPVNKITKQDNQI